MGIIERIKKLERRVVDLYKKLQKIENNSSETGYFNGTDFYTDALFTNLITPESGKIYVTLDTNSAYYWSGSAYVQIGGGEGIPITGTLTDKPITGSLEIDPNAYIELFQPANPDFGEEYAIKKGIYFGADEFLQMHAYKGSGLEGEEPFRQSILKLFGHELALEQYFYNGG